MRDLKAVENYLREYGVAEMHLNSLHQRLINLQNIADSMEAVQAYAPGNHFSQTIGQIRATCDELSDAVEAYLIIKRDVCNLIDSLENPEMREVFACRYYSRMTFNEIKANLFMSPTKAKRLHKTGLELIRAKFEAEEKP